MNQIQKTEAIAALVVICGIIYLGVVVWVILLDLF